ncbi:MAG: hypothetical protein R3E68_18395 [Burkholderiaceae bacterium]
MKVAGLILQQALPAMWIRAISPWNRLSWEEAGAVFAGQQLDKPEAGVVAGCSRTPDRDYRGRQ